MDIIDRYISDVHSVLNDDLLLMATITVIGLFVFIKIETTREQALKEKALEKAEKENHSEADCFHKDQVICPTCASVNKPERQDGALVRRTTCEVCGEPFNVEIHETRYTATKIKNESGNPS